jgi:manganese efflux pump family protein
MSLFTLILISISLAMDAFAVSVSAGLSQKKISPKKAILLASVFGIFQAVMPLI